MKTDRNTLSEDQLKELQLRWQEQRERGNRLSAEDLCMDHPDLVEELRARIHALEAMEYLLHSEPNEVATNARPTTPYHLASARDEIAQGSPPEVPGYQILGVLGRGGMGIVYQARQVNANRVVALKMVLFGSQASHSAQVRFRTEAEAIARLQHPHIVQVYEVGEQEGKPFFSMEFCSGGSLARYLDGTPLPAQEAASVTETLARALDAAHQANILHRDLNPANVLLQPTHTEANSPRDNTPSRRPLAHFLPKVTDFGLAKKLDENQGHTQTGAIMGTPPYMAPEQAAGKSAQIGPAVDVYGLGAILYECLTGRPPFMAATTMDTMMQVMSDEPVPPRQLNPGVPRDLETICLKCLHKDPHRRYANAQELAEDLRRSQAGEPILARPINVVERTTKWIRRHPTVTGLLVGIAVMSLVGLVSFGWQYREAVHQMHRAEQESAAKGRALADMTMARRELQAALKRAREANQRKLKAEQHAARVRGQQRRQLPLTHLAYARVCHVAAMLATAPDRQQAEEDLQEFAVWASWFSRVSGPDIRQALGQFEVTLRAWKDGPPPKELKPRALGLAHACRNSWFNTSMLQEPETAKKMRAFVYQRAYKTVRELAEANNRADVAFALKNFWDLYWGELAIVESPEVEGVMVRAGKVLQEWQSGPPPAELQLLAQELRQACGLPNTEPR